ncbi:MAG: hypothetical protein QOF27_661 [Gaiellaceae bacterium]|nr:hypothetical protein [Gaiellaceae bacterium]
MRRALVLAPVAVILCGTTTAGATSTSSLSNLGLETQVRNDTSVSSNWSGYAVAGSALDASTTFTSVSGQWVQPTASCTSSRSTYSAFWVGLGGFSESSQALEQIGTSADCTATGKATYSMWYELVPAASVPIKFKVFPGNVINASVKVTGTSVTLQIRNLTRKTKFTKTLLMSAPDTSSAEWVAEAPSACSTSSRCVQLPLTDFGTVKFTKASATTTDGHMGTITDSTWSATTIQLIEGASGRFAASQPASTGAVPTALSNDGSAFAVAWEDAIALPTGASPGR